MESDVKFRTSIHGMLIGLKLRGICPARSPKGGHPLRLPLLLHLRLHPHCHLPPPCRIPCCWADQAHPGQGAHCLCSHSTRDSKIRRKKESAVVYNTFKNQPWPWKILATALVMQLYVSQTFFFITRSHNGDLLCLYLWYMGDIYSFMHKSTSYQCFCMTDRSLPPLLWLSTILWCCCTTRFLRYCSNLLF